MFKIWTTNSPKCKQKKIKIFISIKLKQKKNTQKQKAGNLEEAIENLLLMEKQTRQAEDHLSTAKLAVAIVRFCHETKNTAKLNEILVVLSKRRGQFRNVRLRIHVLFLYSFLFLFFSTFMLGYSRFCKGSNDLFAINGKNNKIGIDRNSQNNHRGKNVC